MEMKKTRGEKLGKFLLKFKTRSLLGASVDGYRTVAWHS